MAAKYWSTIHEHDFSWDTIAANYWKDIQVLKANMCLVRIFCLLKLIQMDI